MSKAKIDEKRYILPPPLPSPRKHIHMTSEQVSDKIRIEVAIACFFVCLHLLAVTIIHK